MTFSCSLGSPFTEEIAQAIASCEVLIALIGRRWLEAPDGEGGRRLDDSGDYVRREIETALTQGIRVVPVRVQGAPLPDPRVLPKTLAPMTERQGFELRDENWRDDVASLCRRLEGRRDAADEPKANRMWSGASRAKLIWRLVRQLPPLEWEARPGVAAMMGSLLGGLGTALYFRTLPDILIGTALAVPLVVAGTALPEYSSSSEGALPGWAAALLGISLALSGLYCILRSYSSNQRLEGAGLAKLAGEQRDAVLARKLQSLTSHGWRVEGRAGFHAVVTHTTPDHVLHAILTLLSFGLWAPVWITLAIQGGDKRRAASVDQWGNVRMQRLERRPRFRRP